MRFDFDFSTLKLYIVSQVENPTIGIYHRGCIDSIIVLEVWNKKALSIFDSKNSCGNKNMLHALYAFSSSEISLAFIFKPRINPVNDYSILHNNKNKINCVSKSKVILRLAFIAELKLEPAFKEKDNKLSTNEQQTPEA